MWEKLAERNSRTVEWAFRKIYNYGPKDPSFLACTDLDMILDIVTHAHDAKLLQAARDKATGTNRTTWSTDVSAWDAAVSVFEADGTPEEMLAAWDKAATEGPIIPDDHEEVERIMREIVGPSYVPDKRLDRESARQETDDERIQRLQAEDMRRGYRPEI